MAYLYGKDKGDIILKNYHALREVTHAQNGVTNLGASIVPTSVNYDELPFIIDYCIENGIFPLIGQLEDAGNCSKIYKDLEVKEEDLINFRNFITDRYGINYEMPTCPATISGIHVTNTNNVILDKRTGLSCPWFWLDEPQLEVIGNIQSMNYNEIVDSILKYRQSKISDVKEMEKHIDLYPFGGCGGNAKQLLKTYIESQKSIKEDNKMKIENYLEHNELIPFYASRGIEISEEFENPPLFSYIIKDNNKLIGAITCSKIENTFIIEAIAVSESFERQKIGTKLLNVAIDRIFSLGAYNIILNAKNTKFFEKNGFVVIYKDNVPIDSYSYCFNCPEYQVSCFPKIMKLKRNK